jgi:hypothetical protein
MKIAVGASADGTQPVNGLGNSAGFSGVTPDISQLSRIEAAVLDALTMAISQSIASAIQEVPIATADVPRPIPSGTGTVDIALDPVTDTGDVEVVFQNASQPAFATNRTSAQQTVTPSSSLFETSLVSIANPIPNQVDKLIPLPAARNTTRSEKQFASTIRIIPGVPDSAEVAAASFSSSTNNVVLRRPSSQTRATIRIPISTSQGPSDSAGAPLDIESIERDELLHAAPASTIATDQQKIVEKRVTDGHGAGNQSSQQQSSQSQTASNTLEGNKDELFASERVPSEQRMEAGHRLAPKVRKEKASKAAEFDLSDFLKFSGAALAVAPIGYFSYPAFNRRLETNGVDETLLWVNAFIRDGHSYAGHLGVTKATTVDTADISTDIGDTENSTSLVFVAPDENAKSTSAQIWLVPLPVEPAAKRRRKTSIAVEHRTRKVSQDHISNLFQPTMSNTRCFRVVECAAFRDRRIWRGSAPASARSGATSYPNTFTANAAFPRDAAFFVTENQSSYVMVAVN